MEEKDENLWRVAQKRAKFKKHFAVYLVMNTFFWILWYCTRGSNEVMIFPWPVWPLMGWGIGIALQYFEAYHTELGWSAEKEYEKLKRK